MAAPQITTKMKGSCRSSISEARVQLLQEGDELVAKSRVLPGGGTDPPALGPGGLRNPRWPQAKGK